MKTAQADAWTATVQRRLDAIQTAVLDVIDCGTEVAYPESRKPTRREQLSQDRVDGHFHPTPIGQSRRTGTSNTVLAAVARWETDVERVVTEVVGTVGEVASVLSSLGIEVRDEQGREWTPPKEPPTRKTSTGRVVACVDPAAARRLTVESVGWLKSACDALVDRARLSDGASIRCGYVERLTHVLAQRAGVSESRKCVHGCGKEAPVGRGRVCRSCESQAYRERKAS